MSGNKVPRADERPNEAGDPAELRFDEPTSTPLYGTEARRVYPPSREEELGLTGAAINDGDLTADDAAPETLLDPHPSHSPNEHDTRDPADTLLRVVDADSIGAGHGPDQAEAARGEDSGRRLPPESDRRSKDDAE